MFDIWIHSHIQCSHVFTHGTEGATCCTCTPVRRSKVAPTTLQGGANSCTCEEQSSKCCTCNSSQENWSFYVPAPFDKSLFVVVFMLHLLRSQLLFFASEITAVRRNSCDFVLSARFCCDLSFFFSFPRSQQFPVYKKKSQLFDGTAAISASFFRFRDHSKTHFSKSRYLVKTTLLGTVNQLPVGLEKAKLFWGTWIQALQLKHVFHDIRNIFCSKSHFFALLSHLGLSFFTAWDQDSDHDRVQKICLNFHSRLSLYAPADLHLHCSEFAKRLVTN